MSATQTYVGTLVVIECSSCGVSFGMTEDFIQARRDDHRTWYCPNGHLDLALVVFAPAGPSDEARRG